MADIEAIRAKWNGYPNIQRFILIQAQYGNDPLMRRLERMSPARVAVLLASSLAEMEAMAGALLRGMDRAAQGLPPKE